MEKKRKMEAKEEAIDRISSLPDSILTSDILSHLPLHSAVATSVLSRRWRYLWTHLTHLTFDDYSATRAKLDTGTKLRGLERYIATVDRLFSQFTSPKIHTFRFSTPRISNNDHSRYNHPDSVAYWDSLESMIATVCDQLVERIEVNLSGRSMYLPFIRTPSRLFQCHSLEILSLHGTFRYDANVVISLPKLKELDLKSCFLHHLILDKFLKYCPLLERLSLDGDFSWENDHPLDLSTLSLKTLCIKLQRYVLHDLPLPKFVIINASKLEDITLRDLCLRYLTFIKPFGTIHTANMNLQFGYMKTMNYYNHVSEFAELISTATTLRLNFFIFDALCKTLNGSLPMFDNLFDLDIEFTWHGSWTDLLQFLRFSPNVQNLTLNYVANGLRQWIVPNLDCTPFGFSNLKRIRIERLEGNNLDHKMMKYILRNCKVLELLSISVFVPSKRKGAILWKEYDFCEKLFLLECSSTYCDIKFSGQYLILSSTVVKNKRPHFHSIRLGQHMAV